MTWEEQRAAVYLCLRDQVRIRVSRIAFRTGIKPGLVRCHLEWLCGRDHVANTGDNWFEIRTAPQYAVLLSALESRGPMNAASLSRILGLARCKITDQLTELVDAGVVAWEPGGVANRRAA